MQRLRSSWWVVALAAAVGCSDLTSSVSGVVTLDGEPVEVGDGVRGTVLFRPVEGGATATGVIRGAGEYRLSTGRQSQIRPGDYLVGVRVVEILPQEGDMPAPGGRPITPILYADPKTSGLTATITSGSNRVDLSLDSKAGPNEATLVEPDETSLDEADEDESAESSESDPPESGADRLEADTESEDDAEPAAETPNEAEPEEKP